VTVPGGTGRADVVVVGGGHNGLVAAAYLARAGLDVVVLERRPNIGGAASTGELATGVRVPTLAHTVGRVRPAIVRDLRLRDHGLRLVAPEVRVFAPQPGEPRAVVLRSDAGRTTAGLRDWSETDAAAYEAFDRLVRSLGGFLAEIMGSTPPEMKRPGLGDALAGLQLGRAYRGLGRDDARTLLRVLPMAVADFAAESFESDAIRAAVAWQGVRLAALGPWSGGSTAHLLMSAAGTDGGAAGETVYARGGPGALSDALAAAARAAGARVRTEAEVGAVTTSDGRATGVRLAGGEEIEARAVVGAVDPRRLLVGLVDPVALGPTLRWRAGNIRMPGVVAKVNLALSGTPRFIAAVDEPARIRGRILVAPGIDALERAFDASKYGRVSDPIVVEATIPSLADPSLVEDAPEDTQVMSVVAQYAPYALRDGSWDERREALGDAVLATLETVAPGISGLVTARQVLTPLDLERDHGLTGGHPLHGEPTLDLFYAWRPLFGWARYRMPIDGLYLAASGAHPGGGVTGWPGRNAAREVLADRRRWPRG
jgi:phytoene dehydrogenase-like protein